MIHRSRYTFHRVDDVVFVVDQNGGKSVTNDADLVVRDLVERGVPVDRCTIVYRDSEGRWDQLVTVRGAFFGFRALGARTAEAAALLAGRRAK